MRFGALLLVLIVSATLLGCTGEISRSVTQNGAKYAEPVETIQTPQIKEESIKLLKTAKSIQVHAENWNSNSADGGIVIHIVLMDKNLQTVRFDKVSLPVEFVIHTREMKDYMAVKGRLVYKGKATITSWKEVFPLSGRGIRIPFKDIKTTVLDPEYGLLDVKVFLIDGRVLESKNMMIRIKPYHG